MKVMKLGRGMVLCREGMHRGTSLTCIQICPMHQAVISAVPDLQPGEALYVLLAKGVVPEGSAARRQGFSAKPHFSLGTRSAGVAFQPLRRRALSAGLCLPEELREARSPSDADQQKKPIYTHEGARLVLAGVWFFLLGTVSYVSSLCRPSFFGYRAVESFQFPQMCCNLGIPTSTQGPADSSPPFLPVPVPQH